MLDTKETIDKEPLLDEASLLGGGYYAEYRTDDARLNDRTVKKSIRIWSYNYQLL